MPEERKNLYLTLHKGFVREGIEYTDRQTGEAKTFNSVTLPRGTVIDGQDVGMFEFSPRYVNPSRRGEDWRSIPLLADREVWLQKTVLDGKGNPVLDADGNRTRVTLKVMPAQVVEAVEKQRSEYIAGLKDRSLQDRADAASRSAGEGGRSAPSPQRETARDEIPF